MCQGNEGYCKELITSTHWTTSGFWRDFGSPRCMTVQTLLRAVEERISPASERNRAIPAVMRLLITLRYFATGSLMLALADFAGVSESSASRFVTLVSDAIARVLGGTIAMPGQEERTHVMRGFYNIAGFPCVVGAIDCTHVKINLPETELAETFRCRKGYFSLNVQTVSDHTLKIRKLVARWPGSQVARWPGSAHDQTIFSNSRLKYQLETGQMGDGIIVGDSGYTNQDYMVTPILANLLTRPESLYNEAQIRTRNVVERQYGVWKKRFPVLKIGINLQIEKAMKIIVATAVCHNLAIQEDYANNHLFPEWVVEEHDVMPLPPLQASLHNDRRRRQLISEFFSAL